MNYPFECPKCGQKETITMPIKEYTSEGHYCPTCKTVEMNRTIESLVCGYKNNKDFYGKTSN